MHIYDIIAAKRDGRELTVDEIDFFVRGVVDGAVRDYQASAWLMAVYLRGMTSREILQLTLAMRDSGERIDLSDLPNGPTLDKHSTGGVGDKTTLIVVPILAAAGVPVLKMSGRGLGFSGGTIDKLEAIPGFRTTLSLSEAKDQVRQIGAALIGQSSALAPADKILYALRDVTATIESIPLIASSIMSKKLAAGGQRIVLDVKVGHGAFMPTQARAEELARCLVEIGTSAGIPTTAVLTSMDEPLGRMAGNALEVREAIALLTDAEAADAGLRELCIELAAHGLTAVGKAANRQEGVDRVCELLQSGAAARKFAEIVAAQGGPDSLAIMSRDSGLVVRETCCDAILAALPTAAVTYTVTTDTAGTVIALNARSIGQLAMALGAGRAAKTDLIDPAVGIELHAKIGSVVTIGAPLATLHLRESDAAHIPAFASALQSAYQIDAASGLKPPSASPILAVFSPNK